MVERNPLRKKLEGYTLILGSGSPRRKAFLEAMGLDFELRRNPVEEIYPERLQGKEIATYIAQLKTTPFKAILQPHEILLTSDTVVWHNGTSLAKPEDKKEAYTMLRTLSGNWHEVITAVCFTTVKTQKTVSETTQVQLATLSDEEIHFYINTYRPFDKAGSYGIQEWIGITAITALKGSYTNVVGLPTHLVYKTLMDIML